MTSSPRISVIMGIYNCESVLEEAVDSIFSQTFNSWELIMCDDGSSDRTYEIAERYQTEFPDRVFLLRNEKNMGLGYALNKCLEIARGEYIARMDGDDLSVPERFEKEIAFLDTHPQFALVGSEMEMFDESGAWGKTSVISEPQINDFCKHAPFFTHATVMMRADVLREVGGYTVDSRLIRVEDCHLWFKIYAAGHKGANISQTLYRMRNDRNAAARRTWRARKNGMRVMRIGFRMIGMPWYKYVYLIRGDCLELFKLVIPTKLYERLYRMKHRLK